MRGTHPASAQGVTALGQRDRPSLRSLAALHDLHAHERAASIGRFVHGRQHGEPVAQYIDAAREQAGWLKWWYDQQKLPTKSHGCCYAQGWNNVQFQRMPNVSLMPGDRDIGDAYVTSKYQLRNPEYSRLGIAISPSVEILSAAVARDPALRVSRADGTEAVLPARAILVAAGTQPNTVLAREDGRIKLDGRYFEAIDADGTPVTVVRGLANRYRHYGIGAPLAAATQPIVAERGMQVAPHMKLPMTAVLRLDAEVLREQPALPPRPPPLLQHRR